MNDLVKALQIFAKYKDVHSPVNCSHDELAIMEVEKSEVSDSDIEELEKLSFEWNDGEGYFYSFRFGSA